MKPKKAEKTYPKEQGDEGHNSDLFVPPDRADVINAQPGDPQSEVVNVFEDDKAPVEREDARDSASDEREDRRAPRERASRGDEDDDLQSQSRDVRRRVNRERRLREKSEEQVTNVTAQLTTAEARIAKLEAAQAQIESSGSVREIEAKIASTKKELSAAIEDGNTSEQLDLTIKIADLTADLKLLKRDLADKAAQPGKEAEVQVPAEKAARAKAITEWRRQNRKWWGKRAHQDMHADAIAIDKEILDDIEEGELDLDPYSTEHFEELAKRLCKLYPDAEIALPDGEIYEPDDEVEGEPTVDTRRGRNDDRNERDRQSTRREPAKTNGRAPMGGMGGRDGRRQQGEVELAKKGRVTLNDEDFATMRRFNLDPDNAEHKKRFANERRRTILSGARR